MPPRDAAPDTVALPAPIRAKLDAVIRELRNTPRDCLRDPAEMVHRQNRLARHLESVRDSRVPLALPPPKPPPPAIPGPARAITARERAEAVFGKGTRTVSTPGSHTITTRKGKAVRVEFRNARANGQAELMF